MMDKDEVSKFNRAVRGSNPIEAANSGDNKVNPALIAWLVVVAACLIFFFRNSQQTELDFLFFTTHNKTRWLVIVCIALGVALDRLGSMVWRRHKRAKAEAKAAERG